jgi:RNA polymerase sigma-70 factor (ECF subfamily)
MFAQPKRSSARLTVRTQVPEQLLYPTLSDAVLVVRAKDGDGRALEALVERHEPAVRRLSGYLLHDPQDAEDAAQEALTKLCTRINQFRGESQFTTWLHSLVSNTCRDLGARQRRRQHQELEPCHLGVGVDEPAEAALARDQRSSLRAGLASLSGDQRHVMVMKDVLSLSYEEIAGALQMPVGTVKCHAHRGRARMQKALAPLRQAAGG